MTASTSAVPPDACLPGRHIEGFVVDRVTPFPDLRATAVCATHRKSGARLLHVYAPQDTENCFAVTFPTPPPDNTGVPHILEHAVLGGSKHFPLREPFFEMVKMSMATFINAMTGQACTIYPVASNVKQDFFNLAEVYLDAVFYPELKESTFRREGHHLALEDNADPESPLTLSGIVYSEMKGAYSHPEMLNDALVHRGLFPDTPLGRDAAGDPDSIPDLTYEALTRFHREHYHPSCGLFFVYGDIPTVEHLRFLDPVLNAFDRREVRLDTPRQPRWNEPRVIDAPYPVGSQEATEARTFMTLNWLVGDALDPQELTAWRVLAVLLFGNEAAPLKKALIDSRLGTDLFSASAYGHEYETVFRVGLKGSEPDRVEAFERVVLDTLERLAAEPFAPERVKAAFQQLAYETLEVQTLYPLDVLMAVDQAWPFNADPLTFLPARQCLEDCRARYEAEPDLFNRLVRDGLLANPHRLRVVLRPDREAQARADAELAERMASKRARMTREQVAAVAAAAAELAAQQGVPNSPEALALLPQLKISDLPDKPVPIPTTVDDIAGTTVLRNDVFANGVSYIELDMDLAGLPPELYAWLALFAAAANKMGAAGQSYERIAERRTACTGGLTCGWRVWRHATEPDITLRRMRYSIKTLDDGAADAFGLLGDLLFGLDPADTDRLRDVLTQARQRYRSSLVGNGCATAMRHAARGMTPAAALEDRLSGLPALHAVDRLLADFDAHAGEVIDAIGRLRDFLALRSPWTVSFTGSDAAFAALAKALDSWRGSRTEAPPADIMPPFEPCEPARREGLAGPMKVAYCAGTMPAPHLAHPDIPLYELGIYLANFDYLLPEIRFKGNAYGAFGRYSDTLGVFSTGSYSDPRIVETLAIFDGLRDYVAAQRWEQIDIDRAIIGSAREVQKPIRPRDATTTALARHLRGETDEGREQHYAAMLRAAPAAVKETTLRLLDADRPRTAVCVVSSREKLDEANRRLAGRALAVRNILPS
jgi:hypothetical protein